MKFFLNRLLRAFVVIFGQPQKRESLLVRHLQLTPRLRIFVCSKLFNDEKGYIYRKTCTAGHQTHRHAAPHFENDDAIRGGFQPSGLRGLPRHGR